MRVLAGSVIAVVLASVIGGLILIGPPSKQRDRQLDVKRVQDLRKINRGIHEYWNRSDSLPENLDMLREGVGDWATPTDPRSQEPYTYNVLGKDKYELCATFAEPTDEYDRDYEWWHGEGHTCFVKKAPKED
jgi:hypothetical protein